MRNQMLTTLNFNLRSGKGERRAIYAVFYDGKEQKKVSLNEKVIPSFWCYKTQRAKVSPSLSEEEIKNQMEINKKITAVRAYYEENFLYICRQELITNIQNICGMANEKNLTAGRKYSAKKAINDALKMYVDTYKVGKGTAENVGYMVSQFCRYIEESGKDSLNHLKKDGLLKYRQYLIDNGKTNKRANVCVSWISLIINRVMIETPQFKKLGLEEISIKKLPSEEREEKFALTNEEIEKLKAVELKGELAKYRDAFILQTMLGWRRSDFAEFVNHNTKIYRGVEYLTALKTKKKKLIAHCIITPQIEELREKVQGVKFTDTYRKNIRKIAEKAQLDRVINNKGEKVYQKIASQIARHTFITQKINEGWDTQKIAFFTAHATPNTQQVMERYYIHQTEEQIIDAFLQKMENEKPSDKKAQTAPQVDQNDQIIKEYFGGALDTTNTTPNYNIDDYKKIYYMIGGNFIDIMDVDDVEQALIIFANKAHNIHLLGIEDGDIFALYEKPKLSLTSKKMILGEMIKKQLDKPLAQRIKEEEGKTLKMYEEFADVLEEIRGEN